MPDIARKRADMAYHPTGFPLDAREEAYLMLRDCSGPRGTVILGVSTP
jgi:hypothetical protein